ncbi:MAG: ATP-binding protein, partial [Cyanobacteria bacterium P01_D01_bin.73]
QASGVDPNALPLASEEIDFIKEDVNKILDSMRMGSERIRDIVKSLRNFSRLDEAQFKVVNLHEGLDNTLMILRHRWSGKAGQIPTTITKNYGALPEVECCPGQLNQVFMNLLTNALDAIQECEPAETKEMIAPEIAITTTYHSKDEMIQVAIADNGKGIPLETQNKMFEPFFTTKAVGKGTGLGLAISHEIVTKQHRGTIEVKSAVGEGTTFTITLPSRTNLT